MSAAAPSASLDTTVAGVQAERRHARLVAMYGSKVERGCCVVEYEYPDGSGNWVQCDPADLARVVGHFERTDCTVWIDGDSR